MYIHHPVQLEALMPGTSKGVSSSNEPPSGKKVHKSMEVGDEKPVSRWEKQSSCTKGRSRQNRSQSHSPEHHQHHSRSRSREQRARPSRHVHSRSRSRSFERPRVTQKGQWKEKPSVPVVSQVHVHFVLHWIT